MRSNITNSNLIETNAKKGYVAQIIDGVYYLEGKIVTDSAMMEIVDLMVNPKIHLPDFRPRSQKTMAENFITRPSDVFTIKHSSGCISSSIGLHVTNDETKESFYLGMNNELKGWEFLKRLSEMGGRKVMFQIDKETPFLFSESIPYTHRFGNA